MGKHWVMLFGTILLGSIAGCRAKQLAQDQDAIRCAVLELNTNQIVDNLIRIRRGLPILHLDYTRMTGTISQTAGGNLSGQQTITNTSNRTIPGSSAVTRVLQNVYNYGTTANQVNQLTITADPVLNNPEVYNAYLEFLQVPERLIETPCPPGPGEALIVRCVPKDCCDHTCPGGAHHGEKVYYWVPCAHREAFFKLSLYTVALRTEPVTASPNFDVVVKGILDKEIKPRVAGGTNYRLRIKLDKRIPNDNGYMIATIKGRLTGAAKELRILLNDDPELEAAQPGKRVAENQKTDEFYLQFNLKELGIGNVEDVVKDLVNQKVGIRLDNFVPGGTRTERLLEDIRHQLELQRLDQLQLLPR